MISQLVLFFALTLQILNPPNTTGEVFENEVLLSTGQSVIITWDIDSGSIPLMDNVTIYRQANSPIGQISKLASVAPSVNQYTFVMPGGKTLSYRIRVISQHLNGKLSPAGNEILITRK